MLKLQGVSKTFGDTKALNNIDLELPNRGLVAILGESGSGKSTLINVLMQTVEPSSGTIMYDEQVLCYDHTINKYGLFGVVFQDNNLLESLSVCENLGICVDMSRGQQLEDMAKKLGIYRYWDKPVSKLSGGEKQRVAILRALAQNTPIILADEPTGSLDDLNGKRVMQILKDISCDKLVILVTHNKSFAYEYADRIVQLERGSVTSDTNLTEPQNTANNSIDKGLKIEKTSDDKTKRQKSIAGKLLRSNIHKNIVKNLTSVFIMLVLSCSAFMSFVLLTVSAKSNYIDSLGATTYSRLYDSANMVTFKRKYFTLADRPNTIEFYYKYIDSFKISHFIPSELQAEDTISVSQTIADIVINNYRYEYVVGNTLTLENHEYTITGIVGNVADNDKIKYNHSVWFSSKNMSDLFYEDKVSYECVDLGLDIVIAPNTLLKGEELSINIDIYRALIDLDDKYVDFVRQDVALKMREKARIVNELRGKLKEVTYSEEPIIYMSTEAYEKFIIESVPFGVFIANDDMDTIEYFMDNGIDVENERYFDYLQSAQLYSRMYKPLIATLVVLGVILLTFAIHITGHIFALRKGEIYLLQTLEYPPKLLGRLIFGESAVLLGVCSALSLVCSIPICIMYNRAIISKYFCMTIDWGIWLCLFFVVACVVEMFLVYLFGRSLKKNYSINNIRQ